MLATVSAATWAYLLLGAGIEMEMMEMGGGQMMTVLPEWSLPYAVLIFVMWGAMMVAMMLPTAAPTVLLVTALALDRTANPSFVPPMAMAVRARLFTRLVRVQPCRDLDAMGS